MMKFIDGFFFLFFLAMSAIAIWVKHDWSMATFFLVAAIESKKDIF